MNKLIGYFEDFSDTPKYDPGLDVNCLICMKPLSLPLKTISVTKIKDLRSYFFRVHKNCWESLSEKEQKNYESSIIDYVERPE